MTNALMRQALRRPQASLSKNTFVEKDWQHQKSSTVSTMDSPVVRGPEISEVHAHQNHPKEEGAPDAVTTFVKQENNAIRRQLLAQAQQALAFAQPHADAKYNVAATAFVKALKCATLQTAPA